MKNKFKNVLAALIALFIFGSLAACSKAGFPAHSSMQTQTWS